MVSAGHVNFQDEVSAAFRAVDGVLLCVDAVEGCMLVTERVIRQALTEGLPIILLITKIDRLITELKLPADDAYLKLQHVIKEVNNLINVYSGGDETFEVCCFRALTCPAYREPLLSWPGNMSLQGQAPSKFPCHQLRF